MPPERGSPSGLAVSGVGTHCLLPYSPFRWAPRREQGCQGVPGLGVSEAQGPSTYWENTAGWFSGRWVSRDPRGKSGQVQCPPLAPDPPTRGAAPPPNSLERVFGGGSPQPRGTSRNFCGDRGDSGAHRRPHGTKSRPCHYPPSPPPLRLRAPKSNAAWMLIGGVPALEALGRARLDPLVDSSLPRLGKAPPLAQEPSRPAHKHGPAFHWGHGKEAISTAERTLCWNRFYS